MTAKAKKDHAQAMARNQREKHQMEQNPPPPPPPPPNSNSSSNKGSSFTLGKKVSADERQPNKASSIVKAAIKSAIVSSHLNVLKTGQEPSPSSNGDLRSCLNQEGKQEGEKEKEGRKVEVAPAALSFGKAGEAASASRQKLLDQMQNREGDGSGRFGRGGGRRGGGGRRRRGGLYDDDEEDGKTMTIEEYEARKEEEKRTVMASILTSTPRDQMDADEELARRLHEQMMMEEREERERERAVGRLD